MVREGYRENSQGTRQKKCVAKLLRVERPQGRTNHIVNLFMKYGGEGIISMIWLRCTTGFGKTCTYLGGGEEE